MKIVLIATYEMGRQPFGLASPAGWLTNRGHEVSCFDLSRQDLDEGAVRDAGLIGFYLPMHTATRLAMRLIDPIRRLNAQAHLCAFGLYAPLNATSLRKAGIKSVLGGEFEGELARIAHDVANGVEVEGAQTKGGLVRGSLPRQKFEVPNRTGMPELKGYAHLVMPDGEHRATGYTEASRGCKHLCRHCPIVPVYQGQFRVVEEEIVLADIRQQIAGGAKHITFGDPDFFNGPAHATRIVEELHREFPGLTYDVTIKVEHLKKHRDALQTLKETGCVFVTTAVESLDDSVLEKLQKGHTRRDFLEVLEECRRIGLGLQTTFVAFTPWTTAEGYLELLNEIARLGLAGTVAPIQFGIRLLIPAGSRLLELPEIREAAGEFDEERLAYPWRHRDERLDALAARVEELVASADKQKWSRVETFRRIRKLAEESLGERASETTWPVLPDRATIPYLDEPWYC
jgi:radical SAM superfamily enzyme YgiQ (UPF0313 family)